MPSSEFAGHLRRVAAVLEEAERRLDDLYVFRPNRAVEASGDVSFALDMYETYLTDVAESLRGGRYLTRRGIRQFNRDVRELRRDLDRSLTKLGPAIGAQPFEALEPETTTT